MNRKLNGFNKIDNLSTKYFVLSFVKDIEAIKNHSEIIFSFKDKLSELYDKIGDNEEKNSNGIYRPEKAENSKNEDISFEEVKEKLKETMRNVTIIINDFEKGVIYIAKENNNKNYIKDIIEQLEPLEKSIEELDRYKEVISEFCK